MSPLALVTGATGFVGSHLVDTLLDRGYRVRCLVRATSDLRWLPDGRVELVHGEVTRPETLEEAVGGVDYVFHSAGAVRAPDVSGYERVNAGGTRNLALAAIERAPGLRRFTFVSSLAAGGPSVPGRPRSEEDRDAPNNTYGLSKLHAEEELLRLGDSLPATVLRPAAVYGPRDRAVFLLARMAGRGWTFRLSGPAQPVNLIHVRDLARALVDAAESPATVGERYYLSHPELTGWTAVGALMGRCIGVTTRVLQVPRGIVPWLGRAAGVGAALLGRPNPLPPDRLRDLLAPAWTCDTGRAARAWGFRAEVDLHSGIEETMTWYRTNGWL